MIGHHQKKWDIYQQTVTDKIMELDNIRSQVKEAMIQGINEVLQGTEKEVTLHFVRPNDVVKYLDTVGWDGDNEMDTNGWSWDMWQYVSVNDVWYQIATDGYYQNSVEFSYDDDRNEEEL